MLGVKSSKNQSDSLKTGRRHFPVQYRRKQPNFTANKPKHVFPAIKLNTAYFKHRKAETLLRLKVTWLSCQQAKTSFGNIERPKCSLVTETETKAVLRKKILRQRNSAKRKQNRCFSKIKWKSGWLAAYWKKTFFWCNETENNPILQKTNQKCFLCFKAESNVF